MSFACIQISNTNTPVTLMKSSACLCSISTLLQVSKCQTLDFGLVKTVIENTSKKTETVTYYFDGCVAVKHISGHTELREREKKTEQVIKGGSTYFFFLSAL